MVAELDYPTRITRHHEDHSTPDLGGWHCHIFYSNYQGLKTEDRRWPAAVWRRSRESVNPNSLET
jgi:hypothetical protein